MGDPRGFIEHARVDPQKLPIIDRVKTFREFEFTAGEEKLREQGARCMDCGLPFCHGPMGCPLGNLIPVWNDHVFRGRWKEAIEALHATNNFPEFTGRICPAPCETACVLGINEAPVSIKQLEVSIIDHAFAEGWIKAEPPQSRTGKKVAVVGSGPAGLACAQQLNRAGHWVTVLERDDRLGGLLTYGIPDFKMEKSLVERRVELMREEGVQFRLNANVGGNVSAEELREEFDAIVLCGGATHPRDLPIPGRELGGVHFAMDFLVQQNRRVAGDAVPDDVSITAEGKHVIVIGGGDTGSDCIGTSVRQGAQSVTQFELLPEPPPDRTEDFPWPFWPMIMRTSSSQDEAAELAGGERIFSINTKRFSGQDGRVRKLHAVKLEWIRPANDGRPQMSEVQGSDIEFDADLVLLAMGFLHPEHKGMIQQFGVDLDERGNLKTGRTLQTSVEGIFAAGDMQRGQSLVVWAIAEGRNAAYDADEWLMGESFLPRSTPL
ncbi:glutamate synthase subunit beta [Candidatus Sumerlaeota bacterium]|nr:glutamate synthase subunit beta [Candidatus Sumerlaeota bacterium]